MKRRNPDRYYSFTLIQLRIRERPSSSKKFSIFSVLNKGVDGRKLTSDRKVNFEKYSKKNFSVLGANLREARQKLHLSKLLEILKTISAHAKSTVSML
jgi:hypothetical protein